MEGCPLSALPFGFEVTRKADASLIRLSGEIDFAASLNLMPRLIELAAGCSGELLFDLQNVTLIDSEGLKMLLRLFDQMLAKGRNARITGLSAHASRIIGIAGLAGPLGLPPAADSPNPRRSPWQIPDQARTPPE